jgi:hypothetical protein
MPKTKSGDTIKRHRRNRRAMKDGGIQSTFCIPPLQRGDIPFVITHEIMPEETRQALAMAAHALLLKRSIAEKKEGKPGNTPINIKAERFFLNPDKEEHVQFVDLILHHFFDGNNLNTGEILVEGFNSTGTHPKKFVNPSRPWLLLTKGDSSYHCDVPGGKSESDFTSFRKFFRTFYIVLELSAGMPSVFNIFRIQRNARLLPHEELEKIPHGQFTLLPGLVLKFNSSKLHGAFVDAKNPETRLIFNFLYILKSECKNVFKKNFAENPFSRSHKEQ